MKHIESSKQAEKKARARTEIVAAVALNIFNNYLNIAADAEIGFPILRTVELATA